MPVLMGPLSYSLTSDLSVLRIIVSEMLNLLFIHSMLHVL